MADIARIIEIVEPEAKALGFDLVRVRYFKGGEIGPLSDAEEYTLQIMAERPDTGQLVIEDCAALSHRVSDAIDALEEAGEVLISDAYRLEVSSRASTARSPVRPTMSTGPDTKRASSWSTRWRATARRCRANSSALMAIP